MPLEFADFAHHYQGSGLGDGQQRAHFETFADIMECLVRALWREAPAANCLGINFDGATLTLADPLKSASEEQRIFNKAASRDAGRKIDP